MRAWIYALIDILPWPINKGARWIADRIWGIFNDGIRFAKWIRGGMEHWTVRASNFVRGLRQVLGETYTTLKWIIVTRIPTVAKKVFDDATRWALGRIDWVWLNLKGVIADVERFLKGAINTLRDWANKAVDWLTRNVNALLGDVKKLLERVFGLLGTPSRMAEWLVAAMWSAFLRYLYQQRDRIAAWFLNSSATFTVWLARQLESILVKFL